MHHPPSHATCASDGVQRVLGEGCSTGASRGRTQAGNFRDQGLAHSLTLPRWVFVRGDDGELEFHELDEPTPEQGGDVAERTAPQGASSRYSKRRAGCV